MRNLLFIHAHDVGRYLSPYGIAAQTPALERLAREGVMMRNAHCAAPTCSPSRAAMWTGFTAHENEMLGLVHRGFDLQDRSLHLMSHLGRCGYRTALAGLQHEFDPGSGQAIYQKVLPLDPRPLETRDAHAAERAAMFIENAGEDAWALSVGFFYPHREFLEAEPGIANHVKVPDMLPDRPETREDYARYLASVAEMDRCVGKVLEGLERSGQKDKTLVVFTTDHGIAFPEMKCSLTAHGTGVALIVRSPGQIPAGIVSDSLYTHLDLPACLCNLLGVDPPSGRGIDYSGILTGKSQVGREDIFAEVNFHASAEPMRSVRTSRFNYIERFGDDLKRPWANVDDGPAKQLWMDIHCREAPVAERVALYDLQKDPQERHNLASDPEYADALASMRERLVRWMEETDDPLLSGELKIPAGAKINSVECISAHDQIYMEETEIPVTSLSLA